MLAQLTGAKIFSKLDANSGFWQIPLSQPSRLLTTFITPFGRYCFNKLPFGITSAPEHFQRRMSELLAGLKGFQCLVDDILVFGKDQAEHDQRLDAVLRRIEEAGVTLNQQKCEFSKDELTFLGHIVDAKGIRADPEKTEAIRNMSPPTSIPELRRFLGMANQLGKFTPNLAEITKPLREFLSKSSSWTWGPSQSAAFKQVKEELSSPTTLALYDPTAPTKISADASSHGLGAVILQQTDDSWKPVAYASRSMSETEKRYAQIEKEALAATWACEKFANLVVGKRFQIETDHKPLVPLLGDKQLDSLPPRILRFRLRLDRFTYDIKHVPGKELYTADTLSRAPIPSQASADGTTLQDLAELCMTTTISHLPASSQRREVYRKAQSEDPLSRAPIPSQASADGTTLQDLAELCMTTTISHLPASSQRREVYRKAQSEDPTCLQILKYCQEGWPTHKSEIDQSVKAYWDIQGELTVGDGLLMHGQRIVVPKTLQTETLRKLHEGHQGIIRCQLRARISVWWPGISKQITEFVQKCQECARDSRPNKEPLILTPLPDYPWQKVATDLCTLKGKEYLVTVDYFSRYPEVLQLRSTTTQSVVNSLKSVFARHGIPDTLRSDNGPQFASREFREFANSYQFTHTTSSPHFPASNGQAERAVQTVKHLLRNADDPSLALLSYRTTPLPWCGRSPAELLMGRKIRSTLPQTVDSLVPQWAYLQEFRQANEEFKRKQKADHDQRHRVRDLPEIPDNTAVWITTGGSHNPGRIVSSANAPRSYIVQTPSGEVRRNRNQLNVNPTPNETPTTTTRDRSPIRTRSRTGTATHPPNRLT